MIHSSQDHDFAMSDILVHSLVRLDNLVDVKRLADLDVKLSRLDLLQHIVEWHAQELSWTSAVFCQVYTIRNGLHWLKGIDYPLIPCRCQH